MLARQTLAAARRAGAPPFDEPAVPDLAVGEAWLAAAEVLPPRLGVW
ncbi:hypothetical protein [Arthrobacter sp. Soil736]|nr:hypothetical protein [Arthrobacter sp. Soil736]